MVGISGEICNVTAGEKKMVRLFTKMTSNKAKLLQREVFQNRGTLKKRTTACKYIKK